MMKPNALIVAMVLIAGPVAAQPPGGRGRGGPPPTAREAAPVDLTGYWVSVVTEDWRWRMVTPALGDFVSVPLTAEGRKVGLSWDPSRDEAEGNQCRAYGAAGIMRLPGRLHITWEDDNTLKIDTDYGSQTRRLRFGATAPPDAEPTWQGSSVARWESPLRGVGQPDFSPVGLNPREGLRGRSLEVVTTGMRPGYLRKNGVPYSGNAVLREFFDLSTEPNGDIWFVVTSIVEDPQYLATPFVTSTNFKRLPDASGWNPSPCAVR